MKDIWKGVARTFFYLYNPMAKDPAFLFYSKDWLQGTAKLMPEEKGVYIDLLAHQHQDGDLPNDTKRLARMVGLSEPDFLSIWQTLKTKFVEKSNNRLVNRKLTDITTERSTKSVKNKVTGIFASLIKNCGASQDIKEIIKASFKIDDFLTESDRTVKERLTEWLGNRLGTLGNATLYNKEVFNKGGMGENNCTDIEKYLSDHQKDWEAICMDTTLGNGEVRQVLKKYHLWNVKNNFYPKAPLQLIAGFKLWLINEKKPQNGTHKSAPAKNDKSAGAKQLIESLKSDLEAGS